MELPRKSQVSRNNYKVDRHHGLCGLPRIGNAHLNPKLPFLERQELLVATVQFVYLHRRALWILFPIPVHCTYIPS